MFFISAFFPIYFNFRRSLISTLDAVVKLRKRVPYVESWSEKSGMYRLLDDLNCLPEPGESFDFCSLVDMPVTVLVTNNKVDDKIYSNIENMLPRTIKKASTLPPTKNAEAIEDGDLSFIFEDEED